MNSEIETATDLLPTVPSWAIGMNYEVLQKLAESRPDLIRHANTIGKLEDLVVSVGKEYADTFQILLNSFGSGPAAALSASEAIAERDITEFIPARFLTTT